MQFVKTLWITTLLLAAANAHALGWIGRDLTGQACSGHAQHYGPFDYRRPENHGYRLHIVESYHFDSKVENLIEGMTGKLPADIDYTLRAFPNHHRALRSMARYSLTTKNPNPKYSPAECYFQRAEVFVPDDYKVHMMFGIYLHKKHKLQRAKQEYELAVKYAPKSALAHYNLGLLLLDIDDLKGAKKQAKIAAKLGYPLKGLQKRIARMEKKRAEEKNEPKQKAVAKDEKSNEEASTKEQETQKETQQAKAAE